MWSLTVKTLDSQNHKFDDIDPDKTVLELKAAIASRVNIEADRQRLIFCGRVLQDNKKISEYDVKDRVIHLVQRPPPGSSTGPDRIAESEARASSSRGQSPSPRGRIEHIHVHTRDIPHFLTSPGGAIGHSSPMVRLNVAREMLRQANRIIDRLDNPTGPTEPVGEPQNAPTESAGSGNARMSDEEPHLDDELMPAPNEMGFAAGPIHIEMMSIPVTAEGLVAGGTGGTPPGFAEALSAMFNGMGPRPGQPGGAPRSMSFRFENGRYVSEDANSSSPSSESGTTSATSTSTSTTTSSTTARAATPTATPTGGPARPSANATSSPSAAASPSARPSSESTGEDVNDPNGGPGMRIRHPPPEVLADVLEEYNRTNTRLIVHQTNLIPVLRADATYTTEEEMNAHQQMFNDISQITHFLSHAQHAMSDIMLSFSRPPPRQLRARLFVIPSVVHSRVQTGPIAFGMGAGPPRTAATSTSTSTSTSTRTSTATPSPASTAGAQRTGTPADGQRSARFVPIPGGQQQFWSPISGGSANITVQLGQAGEVRGTAQSESTGTTTAGPRRRTAGNDIQALVNSAIQQAFRTAPTVATTTSSPTAGPRRGSTPTTASSNQQANQIPRSQASFIPLSPQVASPMVGNLNSFDPFLPCSSHHIPSNRSPTIAGRSRHQRTGVASRTSSLDRRSTVNRQRVAPTQGSTWILANPLGSAAPQPTAAPVGSAPQAMPGVQPLLSGMNSVLHQILGGTSDIPNQEDINIVNMIQGVMGQVANTLTGQQASPTIAQFLNSMPDYNYIEGESLITDLLMTLAQHMNFSDLIGIVGRSESSIGSLQEPLRQFVRQRVLRGAEPTRDNLETSLVSIMDQWFPQMEEAAASVTVLSEINYAETAHRFLSSRPLELLQLVMDADNAAFSTRAGPLLRLITAEGTALSLHCFSDGQDSLERLLQNRLEAMTNDVGPLVRQWTMGSAITHLRGFVSGAHVELDEVRRFIVRVDQAGAFAAARNSRLAALSAAPRSETEQTAVAATAAAEDPAHMEIDAPEQIDGTEVADIPMVPVLMPSVPVIPASSETPIFPANLLTVPLDAGGAPDPEGWQGAVPAQWVPIIARDSRQPAPRSTPYSDAYMSGQPSKRRRLNNDSKPEGDANSLIAETLKEAVESSGLVPAGGLENLISSTASSNIIQAAVEEVATAAIQERLDRDPDFAPERFPSAKNFIKKNK